MSEKVYEMLWDCRYCGTKKLLGKTHRHCPSCGAPQENAPRYFPPDDEKVAVEDHAFVGADVVCPACGTSASRAAKHCGGCGSPLEGAKEVARRQDLVHADGVQFSGETQKDAERELAAARAPAPPALAQKPGPPKGLLFGGAGCVVLLVIVAALVICGWRKKAGFEVMSQTWERSVEVERFDAVSESNWCSDLPSGATDVQKSRAQRSTKKVQDGEDCKVKKTDRGDGTFKEKKECTPRYKEEPVLDDKCSYKINHWKTSRSEKATGSASEAPRWPETHLAKTGECVGCEREGKRSEKYQVGLRDPKSGSTTDCEVEQAKWNAMKPGTHWAGEVRMVGGGLACSTLKPE